MTREASKFTFHRDGAVYLDDRFLGYVWKVRGFSYRGTQGWNRGVRIRDFHPTHWECGRTEGSSDGTVHRTRELAAWRLMVGG